MSTALARGVRRVMVLCVLVTVLLASGSGSATTRSPHGARVLAPVHALRAGATRGRDASLPTFLADGSGRALLAYAPARGTVRAETVVYLHGARGRAENGCPAFRGGARDLGWLVCPEAIEPEANGAWSWGADVYRQRPVVQHALAAAVASGASASPGLAVGFSQGSFVALDLVRARFASFRALVLLGADVHPDVKTLRDAGIVRVALGAGQLDATHDAMRAEARRMEDEGLEARFFELGHVGHTYAAEDGGVLRDAIVWAAGGG